MAVHVAAIGHVVLGARQFLGKRSYPTGAKKHRLMGRIPEGSMSTQSRRALLLRDSVAEFERRVNALLDYEEGFPQATLGELEAQARLLSRD
jgi:hypothetical protein